jgi:hypothetical protein
MKINIVGLGIGLLAVIGGLTVPRAVSAYSVGPVYPISATYVSSLHPNTNYGNSQRLWTQNDVEKNLVLLKFDLNQVKSVNGDTPCTLGTYDGTLYLKVDEVSNGGHELYEGDYTPWTESSVTWNNMPRTLSKVSIEKTLSTEEDSVNDWTNFEFMGNSAQAACTSNQGILTLIVKDGSANAIAWKSNEASSNKPYAFFDVGD